MRALDILELFVELLTVRVDLVAKCKDIPPDMMEAVSSVIYAAGLVQVRGGRGAHRSLHILLAGRLSALGPCTSDCLLADGGAWICMVALWPRISLMAQGLPA